MPGLHAYLPICDESVDLHTTEFRAAAASEQGKQAMRQGAAALALTALDLVFGEGLLEAARAEQVDHP